LSPDPEPPEKGREQIEIANFSKDVKKAGEKILRGVITKHDKIG